MDKSVIDDAINRLQGGSTDAPADLAHIALAPACTLEQYRLITSAMYAVLDDSHLQMSKTDKNLPVQQALCLSRLAPIIVKRHSHPGMYNSVKTLMLHWTELHQWIVYLKNDFVDQESVDLSFRLLARKGIVDFLGVCDATVHRPMLGPMLASPGIIATLFSLWRLETHDTRFSLSADPSSYAIFSVPAILDSWMGALSQREMWDWAEILRPFGGDASALVVTALDHLRQDIARDPIDYNLIAWDIHLITTLSINYAIRIPFLNQRSMTLITGVVSSMVDRYAITDQHPIVARCISYGYWYISTYVESTEGLPWVTQIVEAGLLPAMLSTEPWMKHMNGQHSEDWDPVFLLLKRIIPKYTIYLSILKPIIKQLTAIDTGSMPGKLEKDGLLLQSWSVLERIVRRRATLCNLVVSNETHIESCQNAKCDKSGPPGSFKSCAGCFHVHYCSRECQVNDWKNGNHQKYCRDIQARRAAGLVSRLSKRDIHFIDRIIAQDLTYFRDRIQCAIMMLDLNPVVVEINYTDIPVDVDIGSIHTMPSIRTCQCDVPVTQKWDHMVELAQKSTSKKILVRAFLPGGTSEKVKLQCLPLKRVLEDSNSATDEKTISDFDETFDLLYSRTGQSFSVVDAAFPNEAMRAMRTESLDAID